MTQKLAWNKLIPRKINVFIWRVIHVPLPVRVALDNRGIDLDKTLCPRCNEDSETLDHCFVRCPFAKKGLDSISKLVEHRSRLWPTHPRGSKLPRRPLFPSSVKSDLASLHSSNPLLDLVSSQQHHLQEAGYLGRVTICLDSSQNFWLGFETIQKRKHHMGTVDFLNPSSLPFSLIEQILGLGLSLVFLLLFFTEGLL